MSANYGRGRGARDHVARAELPVVVIPPAVALTPGSQAARVIMARADRTERQASVNGSWNVAARVLGRRPELTACIVAPAKCLRARGDGTGVLETCADGDEHEVPVDGRRLGSVGGGAEAKLTLIVLPPARGDPVWVDVTRVSGTGAERLESGCRETLAKLNGVIPGLEHRHNF